MKDSYSESRARIAPHAVLAPLRVSWLERESIRSLPEVFKGTGSIIIQNRNQYFLDTGSLFPPAAVLNEYLVGSKGIKGKGVIEKDYQSLLLSNNS